MELLTSLYDTFVSIFLEIWWVFPLMIFGFVLYYFWSLKKLKNTDKKSKKKTYEDLEPEEKFQVHDAQEKTILDIDFSEKNVVDKLPSVKKLIENLREGRPFLLRSVEAVYIADKLSSKLNIDDNGTMTIEKDDAIKVAEIIQLDPQDLIRYILAMEKKLDPKNPETKIKLADFLYLARNARNFNLLAYGSEPEKEETESLVKMKTIIYNSWDKNIHVKIKEHKNEEQNNLKSQSHEPEIIFENKNISSTSEKEYATIDPISGEVKDPSIVKVEKLDNGHVKIYTKSRKIIEKDDFQTYSYRDLAEEEEEAAKNQKFKIKNNYVDLEKENGLLNVNPEAVLNNITQNVSPAVVATQADLPPDELALYESQFGQLSDAEREEFTKTRSISSLRFRAKDYFYKEFRNEVLFSDELLMQDKFLNVKNIYQIFEQLFDVEFSQVKSSTQKTLLQTICIANRIFPDTTELTYRFVSVHFFLAILYGMVKQESKETFYQNVYDDFTTINEKYVSAIIDTVHACLGVKLFKKTHDSYFSDVIFMADAVATKTRILSFEPNELTKIFKGKGAKVELDMLNKIYNNWEKLKGSIGDSIKIKSMGDNNVAKSKIQTLDLTSEYYFRKKRGED